MKWKDIGKANCSIARALSVLGDRWTLLILRNAFYGTTRFDEFLAGTGISRQLLTQRLARLTAEGIFEKVLYQEQPPRYEYVLLPKGKALAPLFIVMVAWGDKWMDEGKGAPITYVHSSCGHVVTPVVTCSACGEPLHPDDMQAHPGPGAQPNQARPKARVTS